MGGWVDCQTLDTFHELFMVWQDEVPYSSSVVSLFIMAFFGINGILLPGK